MIGGFTVLEESIFIASPVLIENGDLEAATRKCSIKKFFLKFRKIRRKTPVLESLF